MVRDADGVSVRWSVVSIDSLSLQAPPLPWRARTRARYSTAPYADKGLALPLGGRTRGISRNHLLAFASTIDLPQRVAVRVLDDLLVKLEGLEQLIRDGALPFERNVTMDLIREIRFRRRQALG